MSLNNSVGFDSATEQRLKSVFKTLSEKDKRRFGAVLASQQGHGGIKYTAQLLGCSTRTISRGLGELDQLEELDSRGRIRRPGAGRPKKSQPDPMLKSNSNLS